MVKREKDIYIKNNIVVALITMVKNKFQKDFTLGTLSYAKYTSPHTTPLSLLIKFAILAPAEFQNHSDF